MIKPASFYGFLITLDPNEQEDVVLAGKVALGLAHAQKNDLDAVKLTRTEKALVTTINKDSEWMDERIEKEKKRQHELYLKRKQKIADGTAENEIQQDSTVETHFNIPSVPPSLPPSVQEDINSACEIRAREGHPPSKEQVLIIAANNRIPKDFAENFYYDMVCDGWQYINNAGVTVEVTARNVAVVIRGRWKNLQARQAKAQKQKPVTNQPDGVIYHEEGYDYSKFKEYGEEES